MRKKFEKYLFRHGRDIYKTHTHSILNIASFLQSNELYYRAMLHAIGQFVARAPNTGLDSRQDSDQSSDKSIEQDNRWDVRSIAKLPKSLQEQILNRTHVLDRL